MAASCDYCISTKTLWLLIFLIFIAQYLIFFQYIPSGIIPLSSYFEFNRNLYNSSYKNNHISSCNINDEHLVILIKSYNYRFRRQGGTSQWYHLTERIADAISSSSILIQLSLINNEFSSSNSTNKHILYIIFQESDQILLSNPYSRMLITALFLNYPLYDTIKYIAFGYTSHSFLGVSFYYHPQYLSITNIIDLTSQTSKLFLNDNTQTTESPFKELYISCFRVISTIDFNKEPPPSYAWFNYSMVYYSNLMKNIAHICHLFPLSPSTSVIRNYSVPTRTIDNLFPKGGVPFIKGTYSFEHKLIFTFEHSSWQQLSPNRLFSFKAPVVYNSNKNIIIYQRNTHRKLLNINQIISKLQIHMIGWTVELIVHSDEISPCVLVEKLSTATILITPHGFQSTLMLFQPSDSILIEIHPKYYFSPEFYGFLQAGLKQNFNFGRSYFAEESDFMNPCREFVIYYIVKPIFDSIHNSLNKRCRSYICESIAKSDDIVMSESLLNRSIEYILEHFP